MFMQKVKVERIKRSWMMVGAQTNNPTVARFVPTIINNIRTLMFEKNIRTIYQKFSLGYLSSILLFSK